MDRSSRTRRPARSGRELRARRWWRRVTWAVTPVGSLVCCVGLLAGPLTSADAVRRPLQVLQLNLCGSGFAVCYTGRSVAEAASVIRRQAPDLVTLNEVCQDDVAVLQQVLAGVRHDGSVVSGFTAALDRRTGNAVRCRNGQPYGVAVIARVPAPDRRYRTESGTYPVQEPSQPEERVWLCLTVTDYMSACSTHLSSANPAVTLAQCRYLLGTVLPGVRSRPGAPATVLGGDLNLAAGGRGPDLGSCLSPGYGHADGGPQHILATPDLEVRSVRALDLRASTDHPGLLATLQLT
jgi:endonuclease/exonuclease/phosphatase family metal-dependent hydrolase